MNTTYYLGFTAFILFIGVVQGVVYNSEAHQRHLREKHDSFVEIFTKCMDYFKLKINEADPSQGESKRYWELCEPGSRMRATEPIEKRLLTCLYVESGQITVELDVNRVHASAFTTYANNPSEIGNAHMMGRLTQEAFSKKMNGERYKSFLQIGALLRQYLVEVPKSEKYSGMVYTPMPPPQPGNPLQVTDPRLNGSYHIFSPPNQTPSS